MMTTALKELYAFLDAWQVDDAGKVTDRFAQANPNLTITVGTAQGPIPIAETLDPDEPELHALVQSRRRTEDATSGLRRGSHRLSAPSALTLHYAALRIARQRKGDGGVGCPQSARRRRRRNSRPTTSPTGRW